MDSEARVKSVLFTYGTTYLTDYQPYPVPKNYHTVHKEKKKGPVKNKVHTMKDTHTISEVKDAPVPFDLLIKRKDIIATHPRMEMKKVDVAELGIDTGLEEAIRTRPRLVMTPAVSLDDVTDKRKRDILIADTYTSCTALALERAVKPYLSVKAPLSDYPAPAQPITLPRVQLPLVPPEWRMETVTWDGTQLRGFTDPDKEFWIEHQAKMKECSACKETRLVKNQRDLQRQSKMNAARR